jgi:hypothetical protein
MKLPLSASKASASSPSLESTGSAETPFIVGEKEQRPASRVQSPKNKSLSIVELQADEIRTIVGGKQQQIWVFVIDVGVPAVAVNGDRQTKLPEHALPF